MKILKEFRDFINKGNVLDLAVAVIIAGAFSKIVSSIVSDILMPPIGLILGGVNMKDLVFVMKEASGADPAVTLNYGMFLQNVVDFLIIAFSVFMVVKVASRFNKKKAEEAAAEPAPTKDQELLTEIRDLLKEKK